MSHSFGTSRTYQRASRPHLHRLVIGIGPTPETVHRRVAGTESNRRIGDP
jgi:hypothetical protein